jgi:hypothetical protein
VLWKLADEWGKAWLMIFIVKPLLVPTLEGSFQREDKEIMTLMSLDTHTAKNLALVSDGLVFQEKVVLEERTVWWYGEVGFAQMNEDSNLKNQVRV